MESVLTAKWLIVECAYIAWIRSTGDRKKKFCEKRQYVAINKSEPTHEPQKETNTGNYVQRNYYMM